MNNPGYDAQKSAKFVAILRRLIRAPANWPYSKSINKTAKVLLAGKNIAVRDVKLRSMFLGGCIVLALPGLVTSSIQAVGAYGALQKANEAARGAGAASSLMRATTLLMLMRGQLVDYTYSADPSPEHFLQAADAAASALLETKNVLNAVLEPTITLERAQQGLTAIRQSVLVTPHKHLADSSPTESITRIINSLDEEGFGAERRITLANPSVGLIVGLARAANDLRAVAGRRSALLDTWFAGKELAPSQHDELLVLSGRLSGAWDRARRGVQASNLPSKVAQILQTTEKRFFRQAEPWYRELVKAAEASSKPPLTLQEFRRWAVSVLSRLLPLREALLNAAESEGQAAVQKASQALLSASAAALLSVLLMAFAMLALLRGVVNPVRRITAAVAAIAEGHIISPPPLSGVREVDSMVGAIAVFQDAISCVRESDAQLQRLNINFSAALENMSQGLAMYDAAERLTVFNRRFCEVTNIELKQVRLGMSYLEVLALSRAAGNFPGKTLEEVYRARRSHLTNLGSSNHRETLGGVRSVEACYSAMPEGGWVSTFEDVTERRAVEARVAHMAHHDALTGLANRTLLGEHLEQALSEAREGQQFALLCLDLDGFKSVNDTLGHPAGDALLRAMANRARSCAGAGDTVARLGGDEFAILHRIVDHRDDAGKLAERLIGSLGQPYTVLGHRASVGVSVGIAKAPLDGSTPDELLQNADLALYKAKTSTRGGWQYFDTEMKESSRLRSRMDADLRRALELNELILHYQPLVGAGAQKIVGFEALLRWQHHSLGLVSPADFIPLAEETGLIVEIGDWMLTQACIQAARWPAPLKVAVNLSAVQFCSGQDLVHSVLSALAVSGLSPTQLELEITETAMLRDSDKTIATLRQIKNLGVSIALDDFGTGYSSLSHLRSFPFDRVKIDQSFVRDFQDPTKNSGAIIRAVVGLCSTLGVETTAEGVETRTQLDHLLVEDIDELQGYLFGKPMQASEIDLLLKLPRPLVLCAPVAV